jgi:hypothetical protein
MDNEIIDIADLDVIFLTYDEPKKEEYWARLQNIVPWATRVDGVKGSDSAHKAAANASTTDRFILIDGDNVPDWSFFDQKLTLTPQNKNAQFRWRSRNHINGLYYGNGGVSSWTKEFVLNMKTHENSDPNNMKTNIEFCMDPLYWAMHNCYSTTYPNQSPKQAWRAGFREGVKMCNRDGIMPKNKADFTKQVWPTNLQNLSIWQTVGRDVENGFWAILGARLGTHYLMLRDWDYREVQDFDCLERLWKIHENDDEYVANNVLKELNRNLGTDIVELDSAASRFFKQYMNKWKNTDIMDREVY